MKKYHKPILILHYSTSNHNELGLISSDGPVVYYLFSTSNHNVDIQPLHEDAVVYYLFSTSNHNTRRYREKSWVLSIIYFLHQTTTPTYRAIASRQLSIIYFLHQTTTDRVAVTYDNSCLLSIFYIKPQLRSDGSCTLIKLSIIYFLHQTTTVFLTHVSPLALSIIYFLHQTTTRANTEKNHG